MCPEKHATSDELAADRTAMATDRTLMAADRTLMAWTRTAISMIGFGFTIYKFLQYMREEGVIQLLRPQGPRNLGLALIALGVLSLVIASAQHWVILKKLDVEKSRRHWSLSLFVAGIVALLGVLALVSIFFTIGPF